MKSGVFSLHFGKFGLGSAMVNHTKILKQTLLKLEKNGLDLNNITPNSIKGIFPFLNSIPLIVWITDRSNPVYLNTKGRAYYNISKAQIKNEKKEIYKHFKPSEAFHELKIDEQSNFQNPNEPTKSFFKVLNAQHEEKWIGNVSYLFPYSDNIVNRFMIHLSYDADNYFGKFIDSIASDIFSEGYIPTLTEKEREILDLICKEYTSKEISTNLFLTKETVSYYRKKLMSKLNAKSSIGIAQKAQKYNLI